VAKRKSNTITTKPTMKESIEPPKSKPIKKETKKIKPNLTETWDATKRERTGDFWTKTAGVKPKVTAKVIKKVK